MNGTYLREPFVRWSREIWRAHASRVLVALIAANGSAAAKSVVQSLSKGPNGRDAEPGTAACLPTRIRGRAPLSSSRFNARILESVLYYLGV